MVLKGRVLHLFALLLAGLVVAAPAVRAAPPATPAIRFGVVPWFSTNVQIQQQAVRPIMDAVQAAAARPVDYRTAADNLQFTRAAIDHQYDIALVTMHIGALLITEHGFRLAQAYYVPLEFGVYTLKTSSIATLDDLRGRRVAFPDEFGTTTVMATEAFTRHGLLPGGIAASYEKYDQMLLRLFRQDVDAVVMLPAVVALLEPATRDRLVQRYLSPAVNLPVTNMYLISPQVPPETAAMMSAAIRDYYRRPAVRTSFLRDGRRLVDEVGVDALQPMLHYSGNLRLRLNANVALDEARKKSN